MKDELDRVVENATAPDILIDDWWKHVPFLKRSFLLNTQSPSSVDVTA